VAERTTTCRFKMACPNAAQLDRKITVGLLKTTVEILVEKSVRCACAWVSTCQDYNF